MPSWLRGFAEHQPATAVVDTIRGALNGGPVGTSGLAAAWCFGITAVAIALSGILFRRRTR